MNELIDDKTLIKLSAKISDIRKSCNHKVTGCFGDYCLCNYLNKVYSDD